MNKPKPEEFNDNNGATVIVSLDAYDYRRAMTRYYEHWFPQLLNVAKEAATYSASGDPLNQAAKICDFFYADPDVKP